MHAWMTSLHGEDSDDQRPVPQEKKIGSGQLWAKWLKKKHARFVDEAPKHRTGMGEYIVPEGGRPLTSRVLCEPGPAEYAPGYKVVESSAPEWSITGRDERLEKYYTPAPNEYDTSSQMVWKGRKVVLSGRFKPTSRETSGPFKAGPATYNVTNHVTGKGGPKYSIPKAKSDKATVGPQNALLAPQDIPGFTSPGPCQYEVKDATAPRAPVACFTNKWTSRVDKHLPAPCDYFPKFKEKLPGGPSLAKALPIKHESLAPAPNTYSLPSHMGEGPAYTVALPFKQKYTTMSPGFYMREREYSHKEKIAMHARLPEPSLRGAGPGPARYDVRGTLGKNVGPSIKGRHPHPDDIALFKRSPGPAAYFLPGQSDSTLEKRGPDFGRPYPKLDEDGKPAPWDHGVIDCTVLSTKPRAPAYTMASRTRPAQDSSSLPGPDNYSPKLADRGLQWTMLGRRDKKNNSSDTPGPLDYPVKKGLTRSGVSTFSGFTMKSRYSPHVYPGYSRTVFAHAD